MNHKMKNDILVAIEKMNLKIDIIQKEVTKIPEIQKEVAKIPEMQKEVAKIPEMQKEIAKIPEMQKEIARISEMQKQITELQKETRNISRSVAVIEHEQGDKLRALFDAYTTNTEKIEIQEKRTNFCEKKLENHDIELDYIKTKVQGL